MASTPSASALSAVLRCRGKLWARNPPTKRPPPASYGLCVPGVTLRAAPSDRIASAWEAFRRGERVFLAGCLSVEYRTVSPAVRQHVAGKTELLSGPTLTESPGREPLSRLLFRLSSALTGQTSGLHFTAAWRHRPGPGTAAGGLKITVRSVSTVRGAGTSERTVRGGWSGLRGSLLSLTALVSTFLPVNPGSGASRSEDGAAPAITQTHGPQIKSVASSDDDPGCGRITLDKPD